MVAFWDKIVKPPKDKPVKETVASLVEKHEKARRDLSDTLSQTGQFELRQIRKEMERIERDSIRPTEN